MTTETENLPYTNGKVCFESGLDISQSNPYRRTQKAYGEFVRGFNEAKAAAETA